MTTTMTTKVTGTPTSFTLGDLRTIVYAAETEPDQTRVALYVDKGYGQFDPGSSSLSLTVEVEK